ncbi:GGGtGRT protein [Clostridium botulinum]|nr:GGGtGRT protein [Clostridium botulinum]
MGEKNLILAHVEMMGLIGMGNNLGGRMYCCSSCCC